MEPRKLEILNLDRMDCHDEAVIGQIKIAMVAMLNNKHVAIAGIAEGKRGQHFTSAPHKLLSDVIQSYDKGIIHSAVVVEEDELERAKEAANERFDALH